MSLNKNDIIELEIISLAINGNGLARHETAVVFVPNTAPGDRLSVRIIKCAKNYYIGKVEKVLSPSPDRTEDDCLAYPRCGGCSLRHISYEAELDIKQTHVHDAMTRIGKLDIEVLPIIGAPSTAGYRNKAQYPVVEIDGRLTAGFYASGTHRVVPNTRCPLQPEIFGDILEHTLELCQGRGIKAYNEEEQTGILRHIYIRRGTVTGEIMVCLVINAETLSDGKGIAKALTERFPDIKSVVLSVNKKNTNVVLGDKYITLSGRDYIEDVLCGLRFKLSPASFFQVNHAQTQVLYSLAASFASPEESDTLIDLYCGIGTIGLTLAHRVRQLIGVEVVEEAVRDAQSNARANGVENARFLCADASQAARTLAAEGVHADIVVLDPPRKGCDAELIRTVADMSPKRVVYVSCDPATLARDMSAFHGMGYRAEKVQPADMFPRTGHVETVVLMSRKDK
ncbi:MAG: 23S rRNA (uracil(1939)-C(5))-methyltransferase RlmD [Eubacteriales bacterium]